MTRAAIVAAGSTPFGTWTGTYQSMLHAAVGAAFGTASPGPAGIDEVVLASAAFGGGQLGNPGALVTAYPGLQGKPVHRVENACASGGYALRTALHIVRSGDAETVLVVGAERMNDEPPLRRAFWLGVSGETGWERMAGATFPGVYALMADGHMRDFGTTKEHLAAVAVKNHRFAAGNPHAQFRKPVTAEQCLKAPAVADPLGLYDCCSTTDGAAAVVVASEAAARRWTDTAVWITGSGAASDTLALHERRTLTTLDATTAAARQALQASGRTMTDMDLIEAHDCFTIAEILAIEDLGLVPKGRGGPATLEGRTDRGGDLPTVNPSGGLKGKGHPLGATGVMQAVEAFHQVRGEAGQRQVPDAARALTHNVGGSGATCAVHVLEADP